MTLADFLEQWGIEPDLGNFLVGADDMDGDVYLKIAQPRRNNVEEVVIDGASLSDPEIEKWRRKSLIILLDELALRLSIHVPSTWSMP